MREYRQNQLLLNLAKSLFQEQTSLDRLITNIIVEAKKMLKCERCTIFLLDLKMYDQIEQVKYGGNILSNPKKIFNLNPHNVLSTCLRTRGT